MSFEHHREPLAPLSRFVRRLISSFATGLGLVAVSLAIGMIGYRRLFALSWIDAFVNASMILSGMGPLAVPQTDGGEAVLRAATRSSVVLRSWRSPGIIFAPAIHRFLHYLHADPDEQRGGDSAVTPRPGSERVRKGPDPNLTRA